MKFLSPLGPDETARIRYDIEGDGIDGNRAVRFEIVAAGRSIATGNLTLGKTV